MVNSTITKMEPTGPLRQLVLIYAPASSRSAAAALLALDNRLGAILRGTREPLVGQMRLTWWFEALERLDTAPVPAEPVLAALAEHVLPRGVSGAELATMIDGWELVMPLAPLGGAELDRYARTRGGALFKSLARVCDAAPGDPAEVAGRGWALADLAAHVGDAELAERARHAAEPLFGLAMGVRWSRRGRMLGAMALIGQADLAQRSGHGLVARLLWHRITGR
jgi:phytoene synthase